MIDVLPLHEQAAQEPGRLERAEAEIARLRRIEAQAWIVIRTKEMVREAPDLMEHIFAIEQHEHELTTLASLLGPQTTEGERS